MTRRPRLTASLRAFRASAGNRSLLLVEAARLASVTGRWAYGVTLAVYAYRVGGASGVAVAAVVRLAPAALIAPLTGALIARRRVGALMLQGGILRSAALAGAAVVVWHGGRPGSSTRAWRSRRRPRRCSARFSSPSFRT